jgi:ribonuclease HI
MQEGDEVHVYTDGACKGNQFKKGAIAGVGVWFGKDDDRNVSERLAGDTQTNNRAELTALIRAIEVYYGDEEAVTRETSKKQKLTQLVLHTDSKYCKDGIESWIKNWKKNGWKTASRKPVKNKDLWMRLDSLIELRSVKFEWVAGHAGIEGNEQADHLAVAGCSK